MNRPATLLVLLLAGLLAGCGGGSRPTGIRAAETPADDVAEYQPRWRSHTVDSTQYRKVFLAGTIDMGRSSDWQAALVARFRDSIGGRWLFFNPRRREFHASPAEMEYQVAWELAHLEAADLIVMNLLGDSRSPISLLEMGLYARSGKLFVACSPDYYRYDNVRITCRILKCLVTTESYWESLCFFTSVLRRCLHKNCFGENVYFAKNLYKE